MKTVQQLSAQYKRPRANSAMEKFSYIYQLWYSYIEL